MEKLFFELIQITLGNSEILSISPSMDEWYTLYQESEKQSLTSVLLSGMERLPNVQRPPTELLLQWIGEAQITENQNEVVDERCAELQELFRDAGFLSCVLKGQGTAMYYENPKRRQSGDIDLWVTKDGRCKKDDVRNEVLQFAKSQGYHVGHIDIKHSDIDFFEDVPVEVHFLPSWMYDPSTNKKLQRFFEVQSERQFGNHDAEAGFTHTTIDFDLVFSIVHIYRHIFSEGIGLRQLMDYYYILTHSNLEQRKEAFEVLKSLKMAKFVGGIMWIFRESFGMEEEYQLCAVNERHGKYLLSEILTAGNFGQYDDRMLRIDKEKRFERGFVQLKRNLRFLGYYPSEVLWSPFWKLWHWCWRKKKGYL